MKPGPSCPMSAGKVRRARERRCVCAGHLRNSLCSLRSGPIGRPNCARVSVIAVSCARANQRPGACVDLLPARAFRLSEVACPCAPPRPCVAMRSRRWRAPGPSPKRRESSGSTLCELCVQRIGRVGDDQPTAIEAVGRRAFPAYHQLYAEQLRPGVQGRERLAEAGDGLAVLYGVPGQVHPCLEAAEGLTQTVRQTCKLALAPRTEDRSGRRRAFPWAARATSAPSSRREPVASPCGSRPMAALRLAASSGWSSLATSTSWLRMRRCAMSGLPG